MIRKFIIVMLLMLSSTGLTNTSSINFAKDIDPTSLTKIYPQLRNIIIYIAGFCDQNRVKFVITSTIRSKKRNIEVNSKSLTHVEGRAFDMSIRPEYGWSPDLVMKLTQNIERKFGHLGAYTASGKQLLVFNHNANNGTLVHLHFQVYKNLPWDQGN